MEFTLLFTLGVIVVASAVLGWCLHLVLAKPLFNQRYQNELLKRDELIDQLRQEVEIARAECGAYRDALQVCYVRLEVATGGTEAILEAARSMVETTANLAERMDPQGGGTEPL